MLMDIALKVFGSKNSRMLAKVEPIVKKINSFADEIEKMTDEELQAQTVKFKLLLKEGKTLDDILPEAYATVREAAHRILGERHYDTQLIGGIVLHQGNIAEMKTGEGKTLAATLPTYLNALSEKGVHVITVNDYLAKRDGEWMAQVYNFLGLSCAYLIADMDHEEKKKAYNADILYATNNELAFDYLRDNMAYNKEQLVQRELNFAIVDEVDSILIDEARVPLNISGGIEDNTDLYARINTIIPKLKKDVDFTTDEKSKNISLTDKGSANIEEILKKNGILKPEQGMYDVESVDVLHHINIAITAHHMYLADKDYIVKNGEVILIDDFTGRMGIGRRLANGLHQALEAKEGVEIKSENQTLASITYQNYFKLYNGLCGMTGTAMTEVDEFEQIYNLHVIEIPTYRQVKRVDENDAIYQTKKAKLKAVLADIKDCHSRKQPVLIGTGSIDNSEEISRLLKSEKLPHTVLNAKYHEQEAEIIAQAGKPGSITIATNMAGRGTDIKLGGSLDLLLENVESETDKQKIREQYEKDKVVAIEAGGLRVISTQRNESRRIDNQLRGRSGRQGDVGSSKFYISLDDELMQIFAGGLKNLMARFDVPEDEKLENIIISKSIETAQRKIESHHFDIRKDILKYDNVISHQRSVIYNQRKELLFSTEIKEIITGLIETALEEVCYANLVGDKENWKLATLQEELARNFAIKPNLNDLLKDDVESSIDSLLGYILAIYDEKEKMASADVMRQVEKDIFLHVLDQHWRDHLRNLDFIKSSIHFRANAQKNPLNEYKTEAFNMFNNLISSVNKTVVFNLMHVQIKKQDIENNLNKDIAKEDIKAPESRNAQCPCGSGKRYKHCCGKL